LRHLHDEDVGPYFNVLGRVAMHRGDYALAEDFSRAAYDQDPSHPLYVATLAQALNALGKTRAARTLVHDARQKDPSNADLRDLEGLLADASTDTQRHRWDAPQRDTSGEAADGST
jgi:predicted Zn-dependent protease